MCRVLNLETIEGQEKKVQVMRAIVLAGALILVKCCVVCHDSAVCFSFSISASNWNIKYSNLDPFWWGRFKIVTKQKERGNILGHLRMEETRIPEKSHGEEKGNSRKINKNKNMKIQRDQRERREESKTNVSKDRKNRC